MIHEAEYDSSVHSFVFTTMRMEVPKGMYQWASYQVPKIAGCACAGNAGNVFRATDFKENR